MRRWIALIFLCLIVSTTAQSSSAVEEPPGDGGRSSIGSGQPDQPEDGSVTRSDEDQSTRSSVDQEDDGLTLMVIAYMLLWGFVMLYLFLLWRRQVGLERKLEQVLCAPVLDKSRNKSRNAFKKS